MSQGRVTRITAFSHHGGNLLLNRTSKEPPLRRKRQGYGRESEALGMHNAACLTPGVSYGRKLFRSAMEGARHGEETFLHGKPFHLFVDESAWHALKPAAFAACIGALGAYSGYRHRSPVRALAYAVLGGTIGFSAGMAWESRGLTVRMASAAWRQMARTRDEHWLERNPIDYA